MVQIISKVIVFNILFFVNMILLAQDDISITISGKSYSRGGIGYGMEIGLVNLETGKFYFSKTFSIFKQSHSIIENLSSGKYRVFYFQGLPAYQKNKALFQEYFGVLEFRAGNSYYLGNFIARSKFPMDADVIYTIECDGIPKKVIKTLKKRKLIEKNEEIIKTYPYNSDTLRIGSDVQR